MIEYENLGELNAPFFEDYKTAFDKVLESGWYILGKHVKAFEDEFAAYNESKYCIGVANGLDALIIALKSFNYPVGTEILVPSNTYIATILAILHCNYKPILVEPDIRTYNIDPKNLKQHISTQTKAIVVVHLYGKCCNMSEIIKIAQKNNLQIVEDCAQAHGAMQYGIKAGNFGHFGAFSFYPTKNLGAIGDAGAITMNNPEQYQIAKTLRNYGSKIKYNNELIGYNSRLDEVQAALLMVKLKKLETINNHKRRLAQLYLDNLKADFIKPIVEDGYHDVYHIFNIRHPKRDDLKQYLLKHNIGTEIHYPIPPHKQKAMQGIINGKYPISDEIHNTTLSLPISYCHTESDIYQVIEIINKF